MSGPIVFLTPEHVEEIAVELAQELFVSKKYPMATFKYLNRDRLEAALALPKQPYYDSIIKQAAILGYAIIEGHPLQDGNKRIGMTTMLVFLLVNGYVMTAPNGALLKTALRVVRKKISKEDFERWVAEHTRPAKRRYVRLGRLVIGSFPAAE